MAVVDTHAHLQHPQFDGDRSAVLERALAQLDGLVVIGDDLKTSQEGLALVRDKVRAAVGIHPHNAAAATPETLAAIRELVARPGVVAVGEIGLDYHYDFAERGVQREAFRLQLEMAIECSLPVVIHCREAESDLASILESYYGELVGGVMHCFGGNAAFAERCLNWGLHISFAGNVTFPKANELRDVARIVPLDRLLVETDSPYLAPQPVRGRRCEPVYIRHTAVRLAAVKGITVEQLARQTTENARRIFGLGGAPNPFKNEKDGRGTRGTKG
jgi:TatD DNase family protein